MNAELNMTTRSRLVLRVAAAVLLAAQVAGVCAQPRPALSLGEGPARAFAAQRGGGGISLPQATAMALSRYQGRVVRAEPVSTGDHVVYEIRILGNDGRVRTVRIDSQTGAFL